MINGAKLTIKQSSEILGIAESSVYGLEKKGKLTLEREGSRTYCVTPQADLEALRPTLRPRPRITPLTQKPLDGRDLWAYDDLAQWTGTAPSTVSDWVVRNGIQAQKYGRISLLARAEAVRYADEQRQRAERVEANKQAKAAPRAEKKLTEASPLNLTQIECRIASLEETCAAILNTVAKLAASWGVSNE